MVPAVSPGEAFPLGATFDGLGTNFSVFSQVAESVELCLFDEDGRETRYQLPEVDAYCWHGYFEGVEPGCRYGYRVHGPYEPDAGLRCNPAKLLLDPYAKAVDGEVVWGQAAYAYDRRADDLRIDTGATRRRRCPRPSWSTPPSTGAPTGRRGPAGPTPSSTRPTSRV